MAAREPNAVAAQRRAALDAILDQAPIVPVITIEREADAVPLARALVSGGLTALEITLRTPEAIAAARAIMREVPEAIVGLGTVLSVEDLETAHRLGARFALSPGATPPLLSAAAAGTMPFIPGVATASEAMAALAHGFDTLKFFPAEAAGGIAALKALGGPFPQLRFCPTGGIGESNLADWLGLANVVSVGGSWLAPAGDIKAKNWDVIRDRAQRAVANYKSLRNLGKPR